MANRGEKGSDRGRVKVRVIEFEMDGSNQTLRDSIRDIVGAIGRHPGPLTRLPPAAPPKSLEHLDEDDVIPREPDDQEDNGIDEPNGNGTRAPRTRKFRAPKILPIDNFDSAEKSLQVLMDEGSPDSEVLKYLVAAYWFKHYGGVAEVTADHIYTAFRHLGWHAADDVAKPLRSMKSRPYNYVDSGATRGTFAVNHIGDKKVDELIKKKQG